MARAHIPIKLSAAAVAWCALAAAWPATYRCEVDGKTSYGDQPCSVGRQSEVATASPQPSAADRAAAATRLRNDKSAAAAMQRDREKRERADLVPGHAASEYRKRVRACTKLAVRARRAREDYEAAGLREQPKKRVRMLRAEEDRAMLCK